MIKIETTPEFKKQVRKSVFALAVFIATLILMLLAVVLIAVLSVVACVKLFQYSSHYMVLILALGLGVFAILIVIFAFRFLFTRKKDTQDGLVEVTSYQEPRLFQMIREVADEIGVEPPKRVFIVPGVTAYVSYADSLLSLFLPVKKNLSLGMGLFNAMTTPELRSIIAHEFGHYTQGSMRLGSYVYQAHRTIYRILEGRESMEATAESIIDGNVFIGGVAALGVKIVDGIFSVLERVFSWMNMHYMALSREMEFHADAVAVHVAGSHTFESALLRIGWADRFLQPAIDFYVYAKRPQYKSKNIYNDHAALMRSYAEQLKLKMEHGFPVVTLDSPAYGVKTKMVIKDQWASHPSLTDRVARARKWAIPDKQLLHDPANYLLKNVSEKQEQITVYLFKSFDWFTRAKPIGANDFLNYYKQELAPYELPEIFNGYYDYYNIEEFDLNKSIAAADVPVAPDCLFCGEITAAMHEFICLCNDVETLRVIAFEETSVKTFDYDGKKYTKEEAEELLAGLKKRKDEVHGIIRRYDHWLYHHLKTILSAVDFATIDELYRAYFNLSTTMKSDRDLHTVLVERWQFLQNRFPEDQIRKQLNAIKELETDLKDRILKLLKFPDLRGTLVVEDENVLVKYLEGNLVYFSDGKYRENNLDIAYSALNIYGTMLQTQERLTFIRLLRAIAGKIEQ